MREDYEIQYWTGELGVSREQLQEAVDKADNSAERSASTSGSKADSSTVSRWSGAKRRNAWPAGSDAPAAGGALPAGLKPELATLVKSVPANPSEWLYEVKFDGYRMLARVEAGVARIYTRQGHDWTERVPHLAEEFARLKWPDGWYDGEAVVLNTLGRPVFNFAAERLRPPADEGHRV